MILLVSSLLTSGNAAGLESLRPQIYAGTPIDLVLDQTDVVVRYQLPATMETSMSFANIPPVLDLSYLSISPGSLQVSAMGNLVEGDSEFESYVHAVKAILVTWAPASDWPEWAARDSAGYSHEIEAAIYEVERNGGGALTDFEPLIASRSLVHVPWRPTEAPDGSPYPYNGHAFEVTIPFVESVELPDEYMVLISYNTEFQGANPLGEAGPYNALNYGLSRSEVRSGNDPDPSSLVQITPQGWNYSASWGGLGSVMTEVVTRPVREMEEIPSEQPARVGEYLTAFYEEGEFVEQATVRILPRPITVTALQQERVYGEAMVLDETAFAVTDLDGDSVLPNGEVIDTVALNSVNGVNVGTYADEIEITGQSGSNGFSASNYDLSYVAGDLVVNQRAVTLTALQQELIYGDALVLDETAFTVTDLDGDSVLPSGEVIDTVIFNSVSRVNVGTYADEIEITAQSGSNGFSAGNYDLSYVAGDLVVNPRAVILSASQQERIYGDTMVLDETAFTVTDLDGDSALPNGEVIDTVALHSVTAVDATIASNAGTYADEIVITDQAGSNGFSASNYELSYVPGDLVVNQRAVTLTALQQEQIYGDTMILDETAFTVTDLDGDRVLPNGEVIATVVLNSVSGLNVGTYPDEIEITGQTGSNGFSASNYDLSYVMGDLVVNQRVVTLTASQQERIYGDTIILDETAFSVTDLDGDRVLPNGEIIDTVALNSVTGVDVTTTANVGGYANEIEITGQSGFNGFDAGNYHLIYVTGDLVVNPRAVTMIASQQERFYGNTMILNETAFTVTDLDGDSVLPNGEVIDTVALNSVTGVDTTPTANVGGYGDELEITDQAGSNGFNAGNYDLTYVAGDLVVNQRAVTLTALQQERIYGDTMVLDETAFTLTDLDGDNALPNGELIDTVALNSVTGIDATTTANVGGHGDEIEITGQSGSNGFDADNYDLSYVTGDLVVNQRAVILTASQQERIYGETMVLDNTAFTVTDLDGDSVLPNGEVIDAVALNSVTGVDVTLTSNVGIYADEIEIMGQAGSNGFDVDNYDLSYVAGDLMVVARSYEEWIQNFLEGGSNAPLDDPDLDGLTNLMEYALGSDPLSLEGRLPVQVSQNGVFSGRVSSGLFATTVVLEKSVDLQTWVEITPSWRENEGFRSWEWSDPVLERLFVRMRVERTPGRD